MPKGGDAPSFDTIVTRLLFIGFFGGLLVLEVFSGFDITRALFAFLVSMGGKL